MGTLVWSAWRGPVWTGAVVLAVLSVMVSTAPQATQQDKPVYSYTVGTDGMDPSSLGARHRLLLRPDSMEMFDTSQEAAPFPPPLPQGTRAGRVLFTSTSTESLEVNGQTRGGERQDSLENGAYSLAVALGNSVPRAGPGRTSGGTQTSRSSQFLVFGDDDNSLDQFDSLEDDSLEDDDDNVRFMTLGRRYHPDGVDPTAPQDLFIPPTAPLPIRSGPSAPPTFVNPFFYSLGESSEDDLSGEDLSDLRVGYYPMSSAAVGLVRGDASSEERVQLDEGVLNDRYNYVDGQGSVVWGYTLPDQNQHQVVRNDGTMQGHFGWTAPNGHQVSIEYVADHGGYRVISSHGIYTQPTDQVRHLTQQHNKAHQDAASRTPVVNPTHSLMNGVGIPLPSFGSPGSAAAPGHVGTVGIPLPPATNVPGTFSGGVPLPPPGSAMVPGTFSGGVPLPPPGSAMGPGFFNHDTTVSLGGGVPLPPVGPGTAMGPGDSILMVGGNGGGIPLPSPMGPGSFTHGEPGPGSPGFTSGGDVLLPVWPVGQDSGAPARGSGFGGGGVPLPSPTGTGMPGQTQPGSFPPEPTGVALPSPVGLPGFIAGDPVSQRCLLAGKQHPSLLPPECLQGGLSGGGGVPLSVAVEALDTAQRAGVAGQMPAGPADPGFPGISEGMPLGGAASSAPGSQGSSFPGGIPLPGFSEAGATSFDAGLGAGTGSVGVGLPEFGGADSGGLGASAGTDQAPGVGLPQMDPGFSGFPSGPGFSQGAGGSILGGGGMELPGLVSDTSVPNFTPEGQHFGVSQGGQAPPDFTGSGSGFGGVGLPSFNPGSQDFGASQGGQTPSDFTGSAGGSGGVGLPSFNPGSQDFGGGQALPDFAGGSGGVELPGFGSGVEVPLQGPPISNGGSVSLNNVVGAGTHDNSNNAGVPFFELGPPESVPQTPGGPPTTPPLPALNKGRSNHLLHHDTDVLELGGPLPAEAPSEPLMKDMQRPQDVAQVYHDIYGIKMNLGNRKMPSREASTSIGLSLPAL